jgi:Kef-type K+ transport system membrane component KefB
MLKLGGFLFGAWLLTSLAVPRLLPALNRLSTSSAELYQLAVIAECLLVALASEHLGLSIEVRPLPYICNTPECCQ